MGYTVLPGVIPFSGMLHMPPSVGYWNKLQKKQESKLLLSSQIRRSGGLNIPDLEWYCLSLDKGLLKIWRMFLEFIRVNIFFYKQDTIITCLSTCTHCTVCMKRSKGSRVQWVLTLYGIFKDVNIALIGGGNNITLVFSVCISLAVWYKG